MNLHISTGMDSLDRILDGGLERGKVTYIFGRPRSGFKTTLLLNLALSMSMRGTAILFFSLENSSLQIGKRLVKMLNLRTDSSIPSFPFHLCDTMPLDIDELTTKIEDAVHQQHISVAFIDYIQLIDIRTHKPKFRQEHKPEFRKEQMAQIANKLQSVAIKHNISLVVASTLFVLASDISKTKYDFRPELSEFIETGLTPEIKGASILVTHRPAWFKDYRSTLDSTDESVEIIRYDRDFNQEQSVIMNFDKSNLQLKSIS